MPALSPDLLLPAPAALSLLVLLQAVLLSLLLLLGRGQDTVREEVISQDGSLPPSIHILPCPDLVLL